MLIWYAKYKSPQRGTVPQTVANSRGDAAAEFGDTLTATLLIVLLFRDLQPYTLMAEVRVEGGLGKQHPHEFQNRKMLAVL